MKPNVVVSTVLTVFFLALPFACALFSSGEKISTVNYEVKNDIFVTVYDGKTDKTEEKSLVDFISRQIAAEKAYVFGDETVKAVACAITSDMVYDRTYTKETHSEAFLCTDCEICNELYSETEVSENEMNRIRSLVSEVIGTVVFYDGQAIIGARCVVSSGKTESAAETVGREIPYLISKESYWDAEYRDFVSEKDISLDELHKKAVLRWGCDGDGIEITEKTSVGSVKKIKVFGKEVSGTDFCEEFGILSPKFTVEIRNGTAHFRSEGIGSGLGLSEYGADRLEKQGYGYEEILKYYYSGVTVEKAASEELFS